MRYDRIDMSVGDAVYYKTRTGKEERIAAVVIAKNEDAETHSEFAEMYKIRITTNKCATYRKGETFTTSGNFLLKRGTTKKK